MLTIPLTESFNPNPTKINAVHPDIPITVIKNLLLYLNKFLIVTFCVNLSFFHIKLMFSNNTFLPAFGALGLINSDTLSFIEP
ncbi:hypothetical protein D3C73_1187860 [compost metagenome]